MEPKVVFGDESIKWLGTIQKVDLKPGGIVVLSINENISYDQHKRIEDWWRALQSVCNIDNKILILDNGMKISILSPEKEK